MASPQNASKSLDIKGEKTVDPLLEILVCIFSFDFDALSGLSKTRATLATKMSYMMLIYCLLIVVTVTMLLKII